MNKRITGVFIGIILILLGIICIMVSIKFSDNTNNTDNTSVVSDIKKGGIDLSLYGYSEMTEEERQAQLEQIQNGNFVVALAPYIQVNKDTMTATILMQNIEENKGGCKIKLYDPNTDEVYYESDLILPGYSIPEITLNKQLDPGEYNASVNYVIYDTEGNEASQVDVEVILLVQ